MNNIKIKKNKDVYLKIKSKRGKNKIYPAKPALIKSITKDKEPEVPTIQEYLDIALSCDNMFQYIFENEFINKRYYYTLIILTFLTLIMNYSSGYVLLGLFRTPDYAYKYECFSLTNCAYQNCTFRDFCYSQSDEQAVNVCYDTRSACREVFLNNLSQKSINLLSSNTLSSQIYLRFDLEDSKITLFNKTQSNFCLVKKYCILLIIFLFVGGTLGLFVSGILADNYGKRIVIIWVSISIVIENVIIIFLSRYSVSDFHSLTYFFTTWCFISFFSGISLFALEYLVFLNFMEFYPDSKSLKKINAIFHSQFTFTNIAFLSLNTFLKNLFIFYYLSLAFFIVFTFLFCFYFVENPRFFSERKDYDMKMKSFNRIIQKNLVKKEDDENLKKVVKDELTKHGKYWKELVITNVVKNKPAEKIGLEKIIADVNKKLPFQSRAKRPNLMNENFNNSAINHLERNRTRASKLFTNNKVSVKTNFNSRKEIMLSGHNEIFMDDYNNQESESLLKKKNNYVLNLFKIYKKFFRDKFVKKYFLIFMLLWVSIIYCFYGSTFGVLFILANPNQSNLIQNYGVIIYCFLVLLLMPYVIGNLSGIIPLDNKYFVMLTFLIYTMIIVFLDSHNLMPDSDKINYFNSPADNAQYKISQMSVTTCSSLIITSVSLFNLLLITSVPTVYRTIFVSSIKSFGNLIPIFSFLSFYMLDTPLLIMGIISMCGFFIFFSLQIHWRDVKLIESVDNEDLDLKIRDKINNKSRRTSPSKTFKMISHSKTMSNRISIFNRVKQHSL